MEDQDKAIEKSLAAIIEHYEKQVDDLRGSLQVAQWAAKDAERRLEDPEINRRLRVFEQVALLRLAAWHNDKMGGHLIDLIKNAHQEAELILSESSKFSVRKEEK